MAIRPTSARTHSGTLSTPILNSKGRFTQIWESPQGWVCSPYPLIEDDDELFNGSCSWCGNPVEVVCTPPHNVKKEAKTLCQDCFILLAEASVRHAMK